MGTLFRHTLRWLDTDIPYLMRGGGWALSSQTLGMFGGLITALIFAHFLTPQDYGIYKYVLATSALFAIPALSGMNMAVLQAVARGDDGTARVAFLRRLTWGGLGTLAGIALGSYYLFAGNEVLGYGFIIAGFSVPLIESLGTAQAILSGKRRFDIAARQSMLSTLLTVTSVGGVAMLTRNPLLVLVAYFASLLISRTITHLVSLRLIGNRRVSKEGLHFGMHMSIAGVLGIISGNADQLILWHVTNAETLALYAFALAIITPFQALVKSLLNLAHPKFSGHTPEALVMTTRRRARQTFFLLIPLVIGVIVVLPFIFALLFPAYIAAVPYAQVLACSVFLYSEKLYGIALMAQQRSKTIYTLNVINGSVAIGLLVVLIPLFGAWGAVIATLGQQTLAIFMTRFFFEREARKIMHP